jgi:hypothetical protein
MARDDPTAAPGSAGTETTDGDGPAVDHEVRPEDTGMRPEEGAESRGSVAGGTDRRMPVEREPVDLENALFVLLGVVVSLAVFAQLVVG